MSEITIPTTGGSLTAELWHVGSHIALNLNGFNVRIIGVEMCKQWLACLRVGGTIREDLSTDERFFVTEISISKFDNVTTIDYKPSRENNFNLPMKVERTSVVVTNTAPLVEMLKAALTDERKAQQLEFDNRMAQKRL